MTHKWYVARTKALAEYTARDRLGTAGCEVFLPCVGTVRPRRGHKDAPLFPGYLFLHYDLDQMGWQPLGQVPQLVGLVAFDGVRSVQSTKYKTSRLLRRTRGRGRYTKGFGLRAVEGGASSTCNVQTF